MDVSKFAKKEILAMGAGSATRSLVAPDPKMINLGAGDPDFNQPSFIDRAVYNAMKEGYTHYDFTRPYPQFKQAIAEYYAKYGVKVTTDQILKANPGLKAEKLKPGQEIWIPAPQS